MSARVCAVSPGSPAARTGLLKGDELFEINGRRPLDILDYLFESSSARVSLTVERRGERLTFAVRKSRHAALGLDFEEEVFDGLRRCRNRCVFCFLAQNAPAMRKTLYVRDDDYRLSFLHGNFITLTNMGDDDFRRIEEMRLSPLYISVHSTSPDVRERLFGCRAAREIGPALARLAAGGVSMHTQVVLCPGINDGEELERTLDDLLALGPAVLSIAIVPVGLTRFHRGGLAAVSQQKARQVHRAVAARQRRLKRERAENLIYLSDELYQRADLPFPPHGHYQDYPQWENGVGMCRLFLHDCRMRRRFIPRSLGRPRSVALVTGVSFARVLRPLVEELSAVEGLDLELRVARNRFYGEAVTVAGLLTGEDLLEALDGVRAETVLLPSTTLRAGELFLDGVTLDDMRRRLGRDVVPVLPRGGALLDTLFSPEGK